MSWYQHDDIDVLNYIGDVISSVVAKMELLKTETLKCQAVDSVQ